MPNKPPTVSATAGRKAWDHGRRESRHKRGYGTAWEKLRKRVMARDNYLCQTCYNAKPQRITPAKEVDHKLPKAKGGTDDLDNLAAICVPCHRAKSARDQGKTPRKTQAYGIDGWPIT